MKRMAYGIGAGLLLAAIAIGALNQAPALEGRYESVGVNILADGQKVSSYHSIAFVDNRFYALTRIGNSEVQTSGQVRNRWLGHYTAEVQASESHGQAQDLNDSLRFSLLYARHPGARLKLIPFNHCLYSPQTQQLYCKRAS